MLSDPHPAVLPPIDPILYEQEWVDRSRFDVAEFIWYASGKKPATHHLIWLASIFDPLRFYINIISPREGAKSTIAVYAMAYQIGTHPLSTNAIVSVSSDQASARMRMLRSIITSAAYRNVFPNIEIDELLPNTEGEFSVKRTDMSYEEWRSLVAREGSLKDPTIKIGGVGSRNLLGGRFSGILLLDDIQDEHTLGDDNMDKLWRYLRRTLFPCVQESLGKIIHISTRWQKGDICDRMKAISLYITIDIPAILYNEEGKAFSYWPEFWPLDKLMRKKASLGDDPTEWELMYMNNPLASSDVLFREGDFSINLPSPLPKFRSIFISGDQASSLQARADWNVYHTIAEDEDENIYFLDTIRFKLDQVDQIETLIEYHQRMAYTFGRLDGVLFEAVAFNTGMRQTLARHPQGRYVQVIPVPIIGSGDKRIRAMPFADYCHAGKVFFNHRMTWFEQLKLECTSYGTYRWDDCLDAASLYFRHRGLTMVSSKLHVIKSRHLG
jgi:predicted phage terminase large subunit-like protein